jgi:putative FmdB family regulatory protein
VPIYEYRCQQCGNLSEFLVARMGSQPADLKCSHCGSHKMDKALSTIAVHATAAPSPCQTGACPVPTAQRSCCGGRCNL